MKTCKIIQNRADFYLKRSQSVGSSDIPVLLGLSKYKTPYDLWKEKTGRTSGEFTGDRIAADIGHDSEPMILAREVRNIAGREVSNVFWSNYISHMDDRENWKPKTPFIPFSFFSHPDNRHFAASPDCVIFKGTWISEWTSDHGDLSVEYPTGQDLIIEAKSGRRFANIRTDNMDGYDVEDNTANGLPMRVFLQCQWQSFVTGIDDIVVRAIIDTNTESRHILKANREVQQALAKKAEEFIWQVKNQKAPAPLNSNDVFDIYDKVNNEVLIIGGEEADKALVLKAEKKRAQAMKKEAQEIIDDCKNAFALMMGENRYLETAKGEKIATQVITKPGWSTIGIGKIQSECPEGFQLLKEAGLIPEKKEKRYIR